MPTDHVEVPPTAFRSKPVIKTLASKKNRVELQLSLEIPFDPWLKQAALSKDPAKMRPLPF